MSSVATSNEYEIVSINAEPEVDAVLLPEVDVDAQNPAETEVDLKIVGNGNEAELKVISVIGTNLCKEHWFKKSHIICVPS